ncbi:MAG: hypothetical protein U0263_28415 [Polyangiaceae bacterium]
MAHGRALSHSLVALLLGFACSSENTTETASGGSGGVAAGGSSTGGASGSGGSAGTTSGGSGGADGGSSGSDAGSDDGDASGTGGADGSNDAGDAGGAGGSVGCNTQTCDLAQSFCCFGASSATCAVNGSKCSDIDVLCDGKEDCTDGKICCRFTSPLGIGTDASTYNSTTISCQVSCTDNQPPLWKKSQVCKTSGECLIGSCQPAGVGYPTGYKICK